MSDNTNIPTPRTDAASFMIFEGIVHRGEIVVHAAECEKLERELTDISGQLERRNDGFRKAIDLCVEKDREIDRLKSDLAAARKDSERMRLVFNGLLITTLNTMNRDKIVHEFGELGLSNYKAAKAAVEGGER